jgi:hypothetical protein
LQIFIPENNLHTFIHLQSHVFFSFSILSHILFPLFATGVVDTNGKFTAGIIDTGGKFVTGIKNTSGTGGKFLP